MEQDPMTMTMEQSSTAFYSPARRPLWPITETMNEPVPTPKVKVIDSEPPPWLFPIVERLNELGALMPGWGGPMTTPPTFAAVYGCLSRLNVFMPHIAVIPSILPTSQGGVQLEWHCGNWDLEVEFDPEGTGEYWGEDHQDGQQISGSIIFHEELTLAIKSLSDRQGG